MKWEKNDKKKQNEIHIYKRVVVKGEAKELIEELQKQNLKSNKLCKIGVRVRVRVCVCACTCKTYLLRVSTRCGNRIGEMKHWPSKTVGRNVCVLCVNVCVRDDCSLGDSNGEIQRLEHIANRISREPSLCNREREKERESLDVVLKIILPKTRLLFLLICPIVFVLMHNVATITCYQRNNRLDRVANLDPLTF